MRICLCTVQFYNYEHIMGSSSSLTYLLVFYEVDGLNNM